MLWASAAIAVASCAYSHSVLRFVLLLLLLMLLQRVIQQYGYEVDEMVESDEEGKLQLDSSGGSSKKKLPEHPDLWCNDNRARVRAPEILSFAP